VTKSTGNPAGACKGMPLPGEVLPFDTFSGSTVADESEAISGLIDLEFSDYGRDPRFVVGWWIVPGLIPSLAIISLVASRLI
jgi:hypothetical protein